ncbi:MAG: CDP-glycerol glycerophosphotransferase family protein [Stackebrandtia sp.]
MRDDVRRILRRQALPGTLPLAAITVFILTDLAWLGYLLCAAALALFWTQVRASAGAGRLSRVLTVAAALVGAAVDDGAALAEPLAISAAAVLCLLAFEPLTIKAMRTGRLASANLTVARGLGERLVKRPAAACATNLALSTAFTVAAATGVTAWPLVAASAIVAAATAGILFGAWRRRRDAAHQQDEELRAAVEDLAPRFAVYFSGPASAQYQLLMWLPYFDRIGDSYVIILRERRCLADFAAATRAPIVVAPSIANMEHMLTPTLRAVFYVNNSMKNTHCVRFGELTHVQLMHGDSDKPACYNPVTAMYDRVYVAGQAGVDRYRAHGVKIADEQFRIVGRPQVSEVKVVDRSAGRAHAPVVLYAPTWTGDSADVNYCSLPLGERIVSALLERGVVVLLREHPFTRRNAAAGRQLDRVQELLAADAERSGRAHRWGEKTARHTLAECMNDADALICDVSGVASDWLYSEKPFASCDMLGEGDGFTESFPLSRASYVVERDAGNLESVLDDLLDADPLAELRRRLKTYYLGDFPAESYADGFLDEARRCCRAQAPTLVEPKRDEVNAKVNAVTM